MKLDLVLAYSPLFSTCVRDCGSHMAVRKRGVVLVQNEKKDRIGRCELSLGSYPEVGGARLRLRDRRSLK
jgi:hypothetical protein